MQTILCMKWGTLYGPEYVNRLYNAIMRHTTRPTQLICFTDDVTGVDKRVICYPLPEINLPTHLEWTPWRKLSLWQYPLVGLEGDILFLDLDLLITGNLDRFFDYKPGTYCVIENWTQIGKNIGNTSCYRFPTGKYTIIYDKLMAAPDLVTNAHRIEQQYISATISEQYFWPRHWCESFKHTLMPAWPMRMWQPVPEPKEASIVAFTGVPNPEDAIIGAWPLSEKRNNAFWRLYWKIFKKYPASDWVKRHWV